MKVKIPTVNSGAYFFFEKFFNISIGFLSRKDFIFDEH